jgi:hypothetical protein
MGAMSRKTSVQALGGILLITVSLFAQNPQESVGFSISSGGAASFTAVSDAGPLNIGFARILPNSGSVVPQGFELLRFRQNNVLVSETMVPASQLVSTSRFFVEVAGNVNTGVAIANPNSEPATISFGFQDPQIRFRGVLINPGAFTIPPNSQVAYFINEPPINAPSPYFGLIDITSTLPVGITSLRTLVNERSELLMTTVQQGRPPAGLFGGVPVQPRVVAGYIPLFAVGAGWSTEVIVINTNSSDAAIATLDFFGPNGEPVVVSVDGKTGSSVDFTLDRADLHRFTIAGLGSNLASGYIRVTGREHSARFESFAILSFKRLGVTVSIASLPMVQQAATSRVYVNEAAGQLRTCIAINNDSAQPASVLLEVMDLSGRPSGLTGAILVPGFGQISRFLHEIPGFASVPFPFRGMLRVSTNAAAGVSIAAIRGASNERSDFVFSAAPFATEEDGPEPVFERIVPQIVARSGFSAELVLFSDSAGLAASGNMVVVSRTGSPFSFR